MPTEKDLRHAAELTAKDARIAELEAIVAKLPKTEKAYCLWLRVNRERHEIWCGHPDCKYYQMCVYYSDCSKCEHREAAEQAKGNTNGHD
jgi:hypothetical protein